jgi:hypothetical protein
MTIRENLASKFKATGIISSEMATPHEAGHGAENTGPGIKDGDNSMIRGNQSKQFIPCCLFRDW